MSTKLLIEQAHDFDIAIIPRLEAPLLQPPLRLAPKLHRQRPHSGDALVRRVLGLQLVVKNHALAGCPLLEALDSRMALRS
ncbi:hypothetical protein AB7G19_22415 [Bradyrhizobium sp. 215_C5_N1_1]|uniref:hypothetical protein n=1 Tax=unclassified Bradyrhizobium TaxID=2631580 RepID=UPI003F89D58F